MFARAVVATDLGPSSESIVACAGTLSALGVKEAVLVHVMDLEHTPSAEQDATFARQADSLEAAGIRVRPESLLGYAPHAITSLAVERGAGLIVMGSRGQGLFHTGFSGSVSSDVVRSSLVPVLLAPAPKMNTAEAGSEVCRRLLASVLVPVDPASATDKAFGLVGDLIRIGATHIRFVSVVEMSFAAAREGVEAHARSAMESLVLKARQAGAADVRTLLVRGRPDEEVARLAASGEYSLVVLAPRCHETIDQAFGSVTSSVIRDTTTPVLLAPPGCDVLPYPRGKT